MADILTNALLEEMNYLNTYLRNLWERFHNQEEPDKLLKDVSETYSALKEREFILSEIAEHGTHLKDVIEDVSMYGNFPPSILDKLVVLAHDSTNMIEKPITNENHILEEYIEDLINLMEEIQLRIP